jgi:hypothetical protein
MATEKLRESFHWLMPFTSVLEGVKHLIKGAAITVGKTRNKVPYTADELLRSARTLTQKPLLINHLETVDEVQEYLATNADKIPEPVKKALQDMIARSKVDVGQVFDSEFENDAVEYVAQVTDPATQAALPLVKGVSIGAIPRVNTTPPQGIIFTDLSLIFDPETPADPDATAEIMEKLREMLRPASASMVDVRAELRHRVNEEVRSRLNAFMAKVPLEKALP